MPQRRGVIKVDILESISPVSFLSCGSASDGWLAVRCGKQILLDLSYLICWLGHWLLKTGITESFLTFNSSYLSEMHGLCHNAISVNQPYLALIRYMLYYSTIIWISIISFFMSHDFSNFLKFILCPRNRCNGNMLSKVDWNMLCNQIV